MRLRFANVVARIGYWFLCLADRLRPVGAHPMDRYVYYAAPGFLTAHYGAIIDELKTPG